MDTDERYVLISADCHAGANHATYRDYLDAEYRDEFDAWREKYRNPFRDLQGDGRERNWDDDRRISELEADGVVAEVVFPNTVPPFFPTGALVARPPTTEQYRRRLAGIRAHNRWLADWCAGHPERRAGVAQIFLNDVDEAIADARYAAEHGLRGGILLPAVPPDVDHIEPLWSRAYDPLWATCEELGLVVNHHSGGGSPDYGRSPVAGVLWLTEITFFSRRSLAHLIMSGVFERFPRLRFVLTEQGASWVPPELAKLDSHWTQMTKGRVGELKFAPDQVLPRAPSEYFAQSCTIAASFPGPDDVAALDGIGVDRFLWGSDYPHNEGTYPFTREGIRRSFAGTDPAVMRKVLSENTARIYGFDLEVLGRYAQRCGPTVAEMDEPLLAVPDGATSPAFAGV